MIRISTAQLIIQGMQSLLRVTAARPLRHNLSVVCIQSGACFSNACAGARFNATRVTSQRGAKEDRAELLA
jgi:hypothetical protein